MLQIAADQQALCYSLPDSHLVSSLPFADSHRDTVIPRSKIQYLINTEQALMQTEKQSKDYLAELPLASTPYLDSPDFLREVERVKQKCKKEKEGKQGLPELPAKWVMGDEKVKEALQRGLRQYEYSLYRQVSNEVNRKVGPVVMRQAVAALEKERGNLLSAIEEEKKAIEELNKQRRFEQMEAYEREQNIENRIRLMVYKRKKIEGQE